MTNENLQSKQSPLEQAHNQAVIEKLRLEGMQILSVAINKEIIVTQNSLKQASERYNALLQEQKKPEEAKKEEKPTPKNK